jgi:thiol-disulfide isomerase/thioredoxin
MRSLHMRMPRTLKVVVVIAVAAVAQARAQEVPATAGPQPKETYETIQREFKEASAKFIADRKAKSADGHAVDASNGPHARFAERFRKFAEANPDDPAALDALTAALHGSLFDRKAGQENWARTVELLRSKFAANRDVKKVFLWLCVNYKDEASGKLLYEIIERNPDRVAQGEACQTLVKRVERAAGSAKHLRDNESARKRFEQKEGKARLDEELAKIESVHREADALARKFRERYPEFFPVVQVGKPAPELVSRDVDEKVVRLADLKGKVVVLDIWTTWCGPCREMIPHEREMVKRLAGKPFVLISISGDAEKKALTDFLAKEPMPWTHWWNGEYGGILTAWEITSYPTIFVLDAQGVVRFKDVRDHDLEKAVDTLLAEIPSKPAA